MTSMGRAVQVLHAIVGLDRLRLPLLSRGCRAPIIHGLGRTFVGNTHADMRQCPLRTVCHLPLPSNRHHHRPL